MAGDDGAAGGIVIAIILIVYLLPSFVAYARKVPSKHAILALNIFLGWTLIGWVISLVWALKNFKYSAQTLNIESQISDHQNKTQIINGQNYISSHQPISEKKSILKFLSLNEGGFTSGFLSHELNIGAMQTEKALSELLDANIIIRNRVGEGNVTYEMK